MSSESRPIFIANAGLHSHFPLWAPDATSIYFVYGTLPDKLDIWRIAPNGGVPQRITTHNGRVSHPVLLNRRKLMYLASDMDGAGPWLYLMDVERRIADFDISPDGHEVVLERLQENSNVVIFDLAQQ